MRLKVETVKVERGLQVDERRFVGLVSHGPQQWRGKGFAVRPCALIFSMVWRLVLLEVASLLPRWLAALEYYQLRL